MSNESKTYTTNVQTVFCDEMLPMESVRGAQEIFKATAEAEQRHILVKTLFERGVGVPSVEHYRRKQSSACRVNSNKQIQLNSIRKDMKLKLKDAKDHLKKLKRRKVKAVKKIFSEFGEEKGKLFKDKLEEQSERLKSEILKKNSQKTEHLSSKFHPDQNVLPDNLSRYRDASVFSSGVCEDEKYTFQQPLVYGELNFDEDEISALLLDPKFAIYDLLSEEDFEVEIETCLAKMRWNNMNKEEDEEQSSTVEKELMILLMLNPDKYMIRKKRHLI